MDKQTLTALKKCIAKYKRYYKNGTGAVMVLSRGACALCNIFDHDGKYTSICKGCPIYEKTNRKDCRSTPYFKIFKLSGGEPCSAVRTITTKCLPYIKKEIEFLESLLPKSKSKKKLNE